MDDKDQIMSLVVNLCLPPPSSTVRPGMKNAFRSFRARALSSAESGARLAPFTVTSYSNPLPPPPGVGSLPLNSTRGRLEFRWKWLRFSLELPWPSAHSAMQGLIYGIRWAVVATGSGQSAQGEHNGLAQTEHQDKTGVPGKAYGPASQTCCLFSTVALSLSSISSTVFSTFFRIAILWAKRLKSHPRGL